jgi:hypothetical protein
MIRIGKLLIGLAVGAALATTASAKAPPADVTIDGSRV